MGFKGGIHGTMLLGIDADKSAAWQEGWQEGQKEMFLKVLCAKYGEVPQQFVDMIMAATLDKLDQWATILMVKNTLEETLV